MCMSGARSFQHKANAFSKSVWDPHTIVIQPGSGAVSTSTKQICFNGSGSSFQCTVIPIINTLSSSYFALGTSPVFRELYVSISHVSMRVRSLVSAEENNGLLYLVSLNGL